MELRIGILHTARELVFETNSTAAEIEQLVAAGGSADVAPVIRFTDERDRVILVNRQHLAYVEIGEESQRRVGFVA
ncbi:DUF3107 domain-containing protein [Gulosibacter macacae]|uniref:DUF3107 domain-containing protein n=1 Tax=Gulosibacter macacae TaxID=2488791 RepID=A0A3P3W0L1_9MICO|nr:DUF3107 domain-containing protein [Gulosibacter macacae]RRJ88601.1 DUF3107 domain-containing protein [Gulosibacter macacae]